MESIYVECPIQAPIDRIWELTQNPSLHERWDLRFTSITYLPRQPDEPQRFNYETRIGLGLRISGEGESVGESNKADGMRTSSLKFWSKSPLSLIQTGSGYWQYDPAGEVVRFRTRYDYTVRHGLAGRLLDRVFRPLIGWATAWSFDSMRLWAEKEILPEQSRALSLVNVLARTSLAFAWLYHGLVPKLLFPGTGELQVTVASGFPRRWATEIDLAAGFCECAFGLLLLVFWRSRSLLTIQIPLLLGLLIPIAVSQPSMFTAPFEPLTLNLMMIALALCGLIASKDLPSARNCRRRPA